MIFAHKKLNTFLLLASFSLYADMVLDEMGTCDETEESCIKGRKCKTLKNVLVCNNLNVGGNENIAGSITASSFITPSGLLNGISNFAVFSNQTAITTGDIVLWASTPASSLSSGISFNASTGQITLPTSGLFLVQYSIKFNSTPFDGSSSVVAQLQQTLAGVPTNITQAAITSNTAVDMLTDSGPEFQRMITGYALLNVTSTNNNVIDLVVTLGTNATIPAATGTDANAQLVVLQLN